MGRDGVFSSVKFQLKWRFLQNSRIFVKLSRFLKSPFFCYFIGLRPPVFINLNVFVNPYPLLGMADFPPFPTVSF